MIVRLFVQLGVCLHDCLFGRFAAHLFVCVHARMCMMCVCVSCWFGCLFA